MDYMDGVVLIEKFWSDPGKNILYFTSYFLANAFCKTFKKYYYTNINGYKKVVC